MASLSLLFLTAIPPCRLTAQVGHDPSHSPFRDITTRQSLTFSGGWFVGNRARAGVGAQPGPSFGLRFRSTLSGPLDFSAGASYIRSQRATINTTLPESTRVGGPIDYDLIAADIALGLTLTGPKTWHGLAPYVAVGLGVVTPTKTIRDPGGYKAGMGFTVAPRIGVRWFVRRHLALELEARDNTIRYEWPLSYFFPVDAGGAALPPVLNPNTTSSKHLTHNLTLSAGLSYHFTF